MIDWQPIKTAQKDGRPVLLLAKPRAHPPENDSHSAVIGFWQGYPVERWKALDGTQEDLDPTHWAPIPKPTAGGSDE